MKLIIKNKPTDLHYELIEFQKDINGTFENLSKELKGKLLNSLLEEQSFMCAYCMQKINEQNTTIEHIIGQSYIDENEHKLGEQNQLNYDNLLAVCKGRSCKQELHCDKSRAFYQQQIPKRKLFITPLENRIIQNIKFTSKGVIYYDSFTEIEKIEKLSNYNNLNEEDNIKYDIQKILNLNCDNLKEKREVFIKVLTRRTKNWSDKKIKSSLEEYQNNSNKEFSQIAIYCLSKRLKKKNK